MADQTSAVGMERKLSALFSTDVVGYSRLMGEDEEATIRTLTTYRELLATRIQHYRGRVVDSPGDNLLSEFASAVDAVQCAVEIQRELKVRNAEFPDNRKMQYRIGLNVDDVIVEGERLYGDGVNIAARLEGIAEPGRICISATLRLRMTVLWLCCQTDPLPNISVAMRNNFLTGGVRDSWGRLGKP